MKSNWFGSSVITNPIARCVNSTLLDSIREGFKVEKKKVFLRVGVGVRGQKDTFFLMLKMA